MSHMNGFQYVEPRMETLLQGHDGTSKVSKEEFIKERSQCLSIMENDLVAGFQARRDLVQRLGQGKQAFKTKWSELTRESANKASAALALAALETAKEAEAIYGVENLVCATFMSTNPEKRKVKWPVIPTFFPELSAWLLAPTPERTHHVFQVLDEMCPDMNSNSTEDTTFKIFLEQSKLVERSDDESLIIYVKGHPMRAQLSVGAALRIFALSTFVSAVYDQVMNEPKCAVCYKTSEALKCCARCHCLYYCSRECQVAHFPQHKKDCKLVLKELYERYNSDSIQTDITTLHMTVKAFMFPNLKKKVLGPLGRFAEAESRRLLDTDRGSINQIQSFKPKL